MPYVPEHDEVPNPLRPGLRAESPPDPCAMVIFGAGGDLTKRLIIPALYNLTCAHLLPQEFAIIGFDRVDQALRATSRSKVFCMLGHQSIGMLSPMPWSIGMASGRPRRVLLTPPRYRCRRLHLAVALG